MNVFYKMPGVVDQSNNQENQKALLAVQLLFIFIFEVSLESISTNIAYVIIPGFIQLFINTPPSYHCHIALGSLSQGRNRKPCPGHATHGEVGR